jgi:hypothetical protein
MLVAVLPAQGIGPGALDDPARGLMFIATSNLPRLIDGVYLAIAAVFLVITLALEARLGGVATAPMQIGGAAGRVASGLFLLYAMLHVVGDALALRIYRHDPATAGSIYLTLRAVANAANAGALLAAGCTILLAGCAALAGRQLPRLLCSLLIVAGLAMSLSFVVLPIGLLGALLVPIWSIWLGVVLLRESPPDASGVRPVVPQNAQT